MLGSIFVGLSGMNAFSNALRQISNNITNINSNGFKSTDLGFSSLFGAGHDASGQGVALSPPRLDFSQGELRQTDRDLDLAIDGGGFMVLLKDAKQYFLQTGSFEVNEDGNIVLAGTDYKLTVLDDAGEATPVSIDAIRTFPPSATTTIRFADNLSSTATTFSVANIKVFDALGKSDNWQARFSRETTSPAGEWTVTVSDGNGAEIGHKTLKFVNGIVDLATSQLSFDDTDQGRSAVLDFSTGVTSFSSGDVSSLRAADVDGYGAGELIGAKVNDNGILEATYSNEQTKALGAVTIAMFRDLQTLEQQTGGIFVQNGSEPPNLVTSANVEGGRVMSRRAQASNVDLSREFGELILVQRGFQASSQVVSVSNDMIQQLFGIRGQG